MDFSNVLFSKFTIFVSILLGITCWSLYKFGENENVFKYVNFFKIPVLQLYIWFQMLYIWYKNRMDVFTLVF